MRHRVIGTLPSEVADFGEEIRHAFLELGRVFGTDPIGQCSPALDVYEGETTVHVVVDLPGVDAGAMRILAKGTTLLIVGEKAARRARPESSFHLVERDFGRFARAVRLGPACDTSRAQATFADGELHVTIPKIVERRGRAIQIAIG